MCVFLVPAKAPRYLAVVPNVKWSKFTWRVVHPNYQYGRQISYRITVRNLRTEEFDFSTNILVTDQGHSDYTKWLVNLKGLNNYRVNVSLINQVGEGPTASLIFTTNEGGKE